MVKILAADLLITDIIADMVPKLKHLVDEYKFKPGGKETLGRPDFKEFNRAINGVPVTIEPGGSSANTLTTLAGLTDVNTSFLGVASSGTYGDMIRSSLQEKRAKVIPETLPEGVTPETAVSFVMRYTDDEYKGERTIATYPGNAREIMKPELVTPELMSEHDILFMQGSLWKKFEPEFADKLITERWQQDKELWLALPTQAIFDKNGKEDINQFNFVMGSANVIVGNDEELARRFGTDPETALHKLKEFMEEHRPLEKEGRTQRRPRVAFITRGDKGCAVIEPDKPIYFEKSHVKEGEIVNTLGAGDTAFAGFLAGHLRNLSYEDCASLAMDLAAAKVKRNGPRLEDPALALLEEGSRYADLFKPGVKVSKPAISKNEGQQLAISA